MSLSILSKSEIYFKVMKKVPLKLKVNFCECIAKLIDTLKMEEVIFFSSASNNGCFLRNPSTILSRSQIRLSFP